MGSSVTRRKKKTKKKIGFEPISSKFGTPEAEKITLFSVIIFQLFSSILPSGGFCEVSEFSMDLEVTTNSMT